MTIQINGNKSRYVLMLYLSIFYKGNPLDFQGFAKNNIYDLIRSHEVSKFLSLGSQVSSSIQTQVEFDEGKLDGSLVR